MGVAAAIITTRYVNIALGSFWCEGWQPKTTSAVDSGTKQKTEDFEVRKNWVLGCGDNYQLIRCNLTAFKIANNATPTSANTASHIVARPPAPKTSTTAFTPKASAIF